MPRGLTARVAVLIYRGKSFLGGGFSWGSWGRSSLEGHFGEGRRQQAGVARGVGCGFAVIVRKRDRDQVEALDAGEFD